MAIRDWHHDRHGNFLKPSEMAREAERLIVFAAWIVGAILSIFGALSFAELGAARCPKQVASTRICAAGLVPVGISVWLDAFDRGTPSSQSSIGCGHDAIHGIFYTRRWRSDFHFGHIAIPGR